MQTTQGSLPNAHVESFGGHMVFWEYADKFDAALARYLDGLD